MNIVLIGTGGTIASRLNQDTGFFVAGKERSEDLVELLGLKSFEETLNLRIISLFQMDSSCIQFTHVIQMVECMEQVLKEQEVQAFIITHGTDTMEETSYLLSLLWQGQVPVILTGSQLAPTEKGTDAIANLKGAMVLAMQEKTKYYPVSVFFNEHFFNPRYVRKIHASNVNGFGSSTAGSMGLVDGKNVFYYALPFPMQTYPLPQQLCRVALVREHMDMCPELYDAIAHSNIQGVVIEGFGRGHVSPQSAEKVLNLIQKGIKVVLASTCEQGAVKEVYEMKGSIAELERQGAINAYTYDAKKARLKLQLLLSLYQEKNENFKTLDVLNFHQYLKDSFKD